MLNAERLLKAFTVVATGWLSLSHLSWSAPPVPPPPAFVPDQVLVSFEPGTPAADVSAAHRRAGGKVVRTIPGIGVQVVSVTAGTVEDKLKMYRQNPNIKYSEPNYLRPLILPLEGSFGSGIDVIDEQWSLHNQGTALKTYVDPSTGLPAWQYTRLDADIDAAEAWDIEQGDINIKVAVLDSGIYCSHGDLVGKCMHEEDHVTPTVNSYGDPIPELIDQIGHGTHVGGTIAMQTNNGQGGAGVGWNTAIGSFKVCYAETLLGILVGSSCQDADIANAIIRAVELDYEVINMSFGQTTPSAVVQSALDLASDAGLVLVAAAGNNNNWEKFYPAAYDNVISVGASNAFDDRAGFSTFSVDDDFDPTTSNDDWVDMLAPGDPIISTIPADFCNPPSSQCFKWSQGTSMAAPHVSGVAALLINYLNTNDPTNANAGEVRRRLQDCADIVGAMGQDMRVWSKYGRLNAAASLGCGSTQVCSSRDPGFSLGGNQDVAPNGAAVYTLDITNNDSAACVDRTYTLSITSETGNTSSFSLPSDLSADQLTLAPGESDNTLKLTVSGDGSGADGHLLTTEVTLQDGGAVLSDTVTTTITDPTPLACSNYSAADACRAAGCKWKQRKCQDP